jgi:anhydro-N-acetylmuramic acid kinase
MKKSFNRSGIKLILKSFDIANRPLQIIGLNSGTSCDGLDVSLVEFATHRKPRLLASKTYPYQQKVRESLLRAADASIANGEQWMQLDSELGALMGKLVAAFDNEQKKRNFHSRIIASHGHTIRHLPGKKGGSFTFQIGDPAQIALAAGVPVIADFRKSDIAAGGQGAPLSPLIHRALFRSRNRFRAVVNIGGIANATILPPTMSRLRPFAADCGPGNMVIDDATRILFSKDYDRNGRIASRGIPSRGVARQILKRSFFKLPPPKSTGRELFGRTFTNSVIKRMKGTSAEDIIATISEITVMAAIDFISRFAPKTEELYLCGGGAKNRYLVSGIAKALPEIDVKSTADLGYDPDYIESMLWAYLGYCFIRGIRVDSRRFTGAKKSYIPGRLCLP